MQNFNGTEWGLIRGLASENKEVKSTDGGIHVDKLVTDIEEVFADKCSSQR